jgi:hypothetical protein
MKVLALAFLLTALVGAAPAERNAEALEVRDALPGGGGHHKSVHRYGLSLKPHANLKIGVPRHRSKLHGYGLYLELPANLKLGVLRRRRHRSKFTDMACL